MINNVTWKVESVGGFITVCTFNNGYSHIGADDNCWVILNGGKVSGWIFPEAKEILNTLPNKPTEYKPFVEYISK